jgi:glycosyltransferase involved in cell wall biosynthesis
MHACDIALITSRRESGPLVAREAVVCGLPVVSVDIGDLKNWLPPHCIAKERTPEALADAVEMVLKSGETIQLPEIFEKEHVSKELKKLFTRILEKS